MVVWEVESGRSLFGGPNKEPVCEVAFFTRDSSRLVSVQQNGVQLLRVDPVTKKIDGLSVNFGNMKRYFTCVAIDRADEYCYVGTKTGDLFEISLEKAIYKRVGPVRKLFSLGISCITMLPNGDVLVGSGEGKLARIAIQSMQVASESEVMGAVTSLALTADASHFFCGTAQSNTYWVNSTTLLPELRNTCHYERINDVVFPYRFSDVFATSSLNEIRVWNSKNRQELLRIQVPGLQCFGVCFAPDGKSIVSGWSDGKIRAFLPQSGKLFYVINDAHNHGCTAISSTHDGERLVSGGAEGQIRIWRLHKQTQVMEASLKEHRGRVWSIQVDKAGVQALSASSDGSCIIWDLKSHTRILCLFESTAFRQALFNAEEYQVLTVGSDRKITYWQKFDGQTIRSIEGSEDVINTIDLTEEGKHFVTGGQDGVLKLWHYDQGKCLLIGQGHCSPVNKVRISPDQRFIVSVGVEGAVFVWKMPPEIRADRVEPQLPTLTKDFKEQPLKKSDKASSVKPSEKASSGRVSEKASSVKVSEKASSMKPSEKQSSVGRGSKR